MTPMTIQPGNTRPSGKPAGRLNVAWGATPEHVDEAIRAGVNFISVRTWRWRDCWQQDRVWASNEQINRVEMRLVEHGWRRWVTDRNCWRPSEGEVTP